MGQLDRDLGSIRLVLQQAGRPMQSLLAIDLHAQSSGPFAYVPFHKCALCQRLDVQIRPATCRHQAAPTSTTTGREIATRHTEPQLGRPEVPLGPRRSAAAKLLAQNKPSNEATLTWPLQIIMQRLNMQMVA